MSHQIHSKKPSLPSIHFLLHESNDYQVTVTSEPQQMPPYTNVASSSSSSIIKPSIGLPSNTQQQQEQQEQQDTISQQSSLNNTVNNNTHKRHHRQSGSISSLPSELQQLSLSAPAYNNNYDIPERSENHQPSWMMMPPTSVPTTIATTSPIRRPPGASHSRSVSDFTLIKPTALPLVPPVISRNRHQTHRRSVSANTTTSTLDFFKMINNPTATSSNLPYIDEHCVRAHTDSPPAANESNNFNDSPQQRLLFDVLNINSGHHNHPTMFLSQIEEQHGSSSNTKKKKKQHSQDSTSSSGDSPPTTKEYENVMVARDEQTGRYYCPFCNKAFNRPSSLRIHTYSHTGEKPFVCEVEGCGRQFSVQSNMRRHLRVHRLGRSKANK